jgi:hypothetical protein
MIYYAVSCLDSRGERRVVGGSHDWECILDYFHREPDGMLYEHRAGCSAFQLHTQYDSFSHAIRCVERCEPGMPVSLWKGPKS